MSSKGKGKKRRREESEESHKCILCGEHCDENKSNTTPESWDNLKTLAQQWHHLDRFGTVYDTVNWDAGPQNMFFHKICKITFSSKRHIQLAIKRRDKSLAAEEILQEESSCSASCSVERPQRLSRAASGVIHDKNCCVWCMKPEDEKHPTRDRWHIMQTMDAWYAFKAHTVYLQDIRMRDRILTIIDAIPDPFAAEIRYHRSCWKKYVSPSKSSEDGQLHVQDIRLSEVREMFFKHVRLVVFEEHELRTLQSLLSDYKALLRNFGFDPSGKKSSNIKEMLQKEFGENIGFHDRHRKNESTLVYDTSAGGSYTEAAIYSLGVSDDQLLNNVARRMKDALASIPEMAWPPSVEELETPQAPNDMLLKFLTWLKTPQKQNFEESSRDPVVHAFASLLLSYITGKSSAFQTQLSVTLHGLTRSREILDILKKFSLGISYKSVLQLYDSWAKHDLEKNDVCPVELAENIPGIGILDNDDFCEDTLTGADTSHRTNVMFVQPQNLEVTLPDAERDMRPLPTSSEDLKRLCLEQHVVQPYKTVKRGQPAPRPEIDISCQNTDVQRQRGVIHALVRRADDQANMPADEQITGAFGGFQVTVQQHVKKSKPYYFLTFPKPPHKSVVHEVMCRMVAAAEKKRMPFLLLVGDQPVYALMVQLSNENPEAFKDIVPFLGPFHTQCSFMSAIYKRFDGSGLSDILVAAQAIAEGSVEKALCGKHYKRNIRCLRLMYEALSRRMIREGMQDGVSLSENTKEKIAILQESSTTPEQKQEVYSELESHPDIVSFVEQVFQSAESSNSSMVKYWLSFMSMVEVLMLNIHAVKTRNWDEFKASLRMMMPWLHVYDNDRYARWLVEFWLEVSSLPEEKARYLRDGLFAQSMTGRPYSCLPLDLWIEMTMNKGSKMKAGWLKILRNEKMLLTTTRNVNSVNRVRAALHTLAQMKTSALKHIENTPSRLKIDEQVVQDLDSCITEFDCDPFDLDKPQLRALVSGVVASGDLVRDFESAHEDGETRVTQFFRERMFLQNTPFDATIHRCSRYTFSKPPVTRDSVSGKVTKTDAMENRAMASLIWLAESGEEKFTLAQVMEFRVTDECLPIFNINGTMKKVQKSKLVEKLNMQPVEPFPDQYIALVDMGFLWRLATPTAEDREKADGSALTWGDYAEKLFSVIRRRHPNASQIVFVNDAYGVENSIKDSEHERRKSTTAYRDGSRNVYMKTSDRFPATKNFQVLFSNQGNKQRLQKFLKDEFTKLVKNHREIDFVYSIRQNCWNISSGERMEEFECSHIEADTILFFIYSQIRKAGKMETVVIDAEDTDVVILSAYVAHQLEGTLAIKRKDKIISCRDLCSDDVAEILIPLHIHSGSDTTSGFYGHGKKTVYEKGTGTQEARNLLKDVGKTLPVTQEVLQQMATFTIRHIYNDTISKTLGEARARKWGEMKNKSTSRIPPDPDSHNLHVTRVNYQVYIQLNYDKPDAPPNPTNHGWTMKDGRCVSVRYTHDALPRSLHDLVEQEQTLLHDDDEAESNDEVCDSGASDSDSD